MNRKSSLIRGLEIIECQMSNVECCVIPTSSWSWNQRDYYHIPSTKSIARRCHHRRIRMSVYIITLSSPNSSHQMYKDKDHPSMNIQVELRHVSCVFAGILPLMIILHLKNCVICHAVYLLVFSCALRRSWPPLQALVFGRVYKILRIELCGPRPYEPRQRYRIIQELSIACAH